MQRPYGRKIAVGFRSETQPTSIATFKMKQSTTAVSSLKMWIKNLTPQPPSLQGKGGISPLSKAGEGEGQGGLLGYSLLTHHFKLDAPYAD